MADRKTRWLMLLGLALLATVMPGSASAQSPENVVATELAELPVIQEFIIDHSDRMTVPVRINGGEPVPFIVDTGAERTVIANDLAEHLALEVGPKLTLATITGRVVVQSFVIESLTTSVIDMGVIEAPGLERRNLGAYGLLGIDSLEDRKVLLDFRGQKMEILPSPLKKGRSSLENGMIVVRATRRAGRMILSNAKIGSFDIDVILDTGAQSSMGNTALRERLRGRDLLYEYKPVVLRSVLGENITGDFTQIKGIEIGGLAIRDLPITFTENYAFDALKLDKRPAILLGMDALKLFDRVVIDFANRRVAFDLPSSAERGITR